MDPFLWKQTFQNSTPPQVFIQAAEPNFMINKIVMGEYKVMDILAICRKKNLLSPVWGHSVHFQKFPMLRFSNVYCSPIFIQFQPNFIVSMFGHEGI